MARFVVSAAVGALFLMNPATAAYAGVAFSVTCGAAPGLSPNDDEPFAGIPATEPAAGFPVTDTA
ncbi:MAG: hypothetical protein ACAH06_06385 [Methylophilaceae bacterium]